MNVTCVINAKPEVESAYVSYRRVMSDDAVITLLPGEFRVHYTVELLDGVGLLLQCVTKCVSYPTITIVLYCIH